MSKIPDDFHFVRREHAPADGSFSVKLGRKRRTNLEITAEILSLCIQPCTRTRVMYMTNLSWKASRKYLSALVSRELLKMRHSQVKYATTPKGRVFLEKWKELSQIL